MTDQDNIIQFLRTVGPTLPSKVAKSLNCEILIASAHLSDLSSQGKIKISKLKIGGSPLYYLPGQEDKLYSFAAGNMNQKDLQVLDHLKSDLILRELNLDLLHKVALRSLKDFAIPLHVTIHGQKELFWKWHLLSGEETNHFIGRMLAGPDTPSQRNVGPQLPVATDSNIRETTPNEPTSRETTSNEKTSSETTSNEKTSSETTSNEKTSSETTSNEKTSSETRSAESTFNETTTETAPAVNLQEETAHSIGDYQERGKISENITSSSTRSETISDLSSSADLPEEIKFDTKAQKTLLESSAQPIQTEPEKKPFLQKVKEKIRKRKAVSETFLPEVEQLCQKLTIEIEQKETIRKNAEINLTVKVPSVVGEMKYFCKAKNKGKCDEKDLSSAYMEAQIKKLPLLFLFSGEINKKAQEMLESGVFENTVVRKV
jgi:hypothetical protein